MFGYTGLVRGTVGGMFGYTGLVRGTAGVCLVIQAW